MLIKFDKVLYVLGSIISLSNSSTVKGQDYLYTIVYNAWRIYIRKGFNLFSYAFKQSNQINLMVKSSVCYTIFLIISDCYQCYTVKTSIVTAINAVIARIPCFPACCKSVFPPLCDHLVQN